MLLSLLSSPAFPAGLKLLSLQEKIAMSDLIVSVEVINTYKQENDPLGLWHAECKITELFAGDIYDESIDVRFKKIRRKRAPIKLATGKEYILFLKNMGDSYDLVHLFQGAYIKYRSYTVYDEELSESSRGTKMDHNEIVERIRTILER